MMLKSSRLLFVLILCSTTSLHSLIILTDGFASGAENTAANTMWFEEAGDVFEALKKAGAAKGHDTHFLNGTNQAV